jgi:hypothetical protein
MSKTATYSLIESQTLGSAQASVIFSSIPATFTDLILITKTPTISSNYNLRFNGDTATNYSYTGLYGDGTSASSGRSTNNTVIGLTYTSSGAPMGRLQIQDYASTNVYKSVLLRQDDSSTATMAIVGLWRSTAAINSITIVSGGTIPTGSTFKLYGIQAGNA